ncbi:MAG: hypothetical protein GF332_04505 [Candidatus Moranbacteria bacterium]|nr:hypothetical protein [Candidatus Moranbacteria bacterium]
MTYQLLKTDLAGYLQLIKVNNSEIEKNFPSIVGKLLFKSKIKNQGKISKLKLLVFLIFKTKGQHKESSNKKALVVGVNGKNFNFIHRNLINKNRTFFVISEMSKISNQLKKQLRLGIGSIINKIGNYQLRLLINGDNPDLLRLSKYLNPKKIITFGLRDSNMIYIKKLGLKAINRKDKQNYYKLIYKKNYIPIVLKRKLNQQGLADLSAIFAIGFAKKLNMLKIAEKIKQLSFLR